MHRKVLDSLQSSASSVEGLGLVLSGSQMHAASNAILQVICVVTLPPSLITVLCCNRRTHGEDTIQTLDAQTIGIWLPRLTHPRHTKSIDLIGQRPMMRQRQR